MLTGKVDVNTFKITHAKTNKEKKWKEVQQMTISVLTEKINHMKDRVRVDQIDFKKVATSK